MEGKQELGFCLNTQLQGIISQENVIALHRGTGLYMKDGMCPLTLSTYLKGTKKGCVEGHKKVCLMNLHCIYAIEGFQN